MTPRRGKFDEQYFRDFLIGIIICILSISIVGMVLRLLWS